MCDTINKKLLELQDLKYREFHKKLIPNIDEKRIIGVRSPDLRKLASEIHRSGCAASFMEKLPHTYYEENNLHGFLIEKISDYNECIDRLNEILPYVDNWATCDSMTPKVLKKNLPDLMQNIRRWVKSKHEYTVRFGIEMLMKFFLDDEFRAEYLEIAAVSSEKYYIKMMSAWFFATALAKQYDSAVIYLEKKKLDVWVHNKTIQKAVESYRISKEIKEYLKTLRIK